MKYLKAQKNEYKALRDNFSKLEHEVSKLSDLFLNDALLETLVDDFQDDLGKQYGDLNREALAVSVRRIGKELAEIAKDINRLEGAVYSTVVYNMQENP